jgi:diaminopimelate epimerase
MGLRFSKMHGAGNDFVLIDRRQASDALAAALVARLCDRHRGVGCDQLLTIEPARTPASAFAYAIWNQDGSAAGQCGNGARCVIAWARRAGLFSGDQVQADSPSGPIIARIDAAGVEIDIGRPDFAAEAVGFQGRDAPRSLQVDGREWRFGLVSMGNPHAVVEVEDLASTPVQAVGSALQQDARFVDSCNVGFAQLLDRRRLRLRVFERGVGETLACGSGACAAVAMLRHDGRLDDTVQVDLPGGSLQVHWPAPEQSLRLRGPAEFVFEGEFHL